MSITFDQISPSDRDDVRMLNAEYIAWVVAGVEREFGYAPETMLGMPIERYAEDNMAKLYTYAPPHGSFQIGRFDGAIAAMGGFRALPDGAGEIKRIYVRPQFRGRNLGSMLFERIFADARALGYTSLRLDTGPFMKAAIRLYSTHGFVERGPYEGVEISSLVHDRWLYMERAL